MIKIYNTDLKTNKTDEINTFEKGSWINIVRPTEEEISKVCQELKIRDEFVRCSLDLEEQARTDREDDDNTKLFIIDVPVIEKNKNTHKEECTTMPIGIIFVRDDYIITVSSEKNQTIDEIAENKLKNLVTYKKSRMLLQIFYKNATLFLRYLKKINKETEVAEEALQTSLRNKELLTMLSLEKSLVYFATSLKSNEAVMERTLRGKIIPLYDEDEDVLEDAITENRQAIEMSQIYSNILNGTMDTYASIISNNLNIVMKTLTSITIIIAIPTLISGFWGMNVPMPFGNHPFGFAIVIALSIIITLIITIWLRKKKMLN